MLEDRPLNPFWHSLDEKIISIFSNSASIFQGPSTNFRSEPPPNFASSRESTDTHIFNGNLFRMYIFFVSIPLIPLSNSAQFPSRGKTIRREESFFNSHIHTKHFLAFPSPPPHPTPPKQSFCGGCLLALLAAFPKMFVLLLMICGYAEVRWVGGDGW